MNDMNVNDCYELIADAPTHCIAEEYIKRHCPVMREVSKASIHACSRKGECWVYRMRVREGNENAL